MCKKKEHWNLGKEDQTSVEQNVLDRSTTIDESILIYLLSRKGLFTQNMIFIADASPMSVFLQLKSAYESGVKNLEIFWASLYWPEKRKAFHFTLAMNADVSVSLVALTALRSKFRILLCWKPRNMTRTFWAQWPIGNCLDSWLMRYNTTRSSTIYAFLNHIAVTTSLSQSKRIMFCFKVERDVKFYAKTWSCRHWCVSHIFNNSWKNDYKMSGRSKIYCAHIALFVLFCGTSLGHEYLENLDSLRKMLIQNDDTSFCLNETSGTAIDCKIVYNFGEEKTEMIGISSGDGNVGCVDMMINANKGRDKEGGTDKNSFLRTIYERDIWDCVDRQ